MANQDRINISRRRFLSGAIAGVSVVTAAGALTGCQPVGPAAAPGAPSATSATATPSATQKKDQYKMVFIQQQPHTVSTGWGQGIEEVTKNQQNIDFKVLDGQNKLDTQINLMQTAISQKVDVIFLQPMDSVALGPQIAKAREAGIPVITLNIAANEPHAAHVEMNHYFGAKAIAEKMGAMMGGKGNVVILNAPPGIVIRDQRTNGFVDGMKEKYPDIKIIADQVADWDRKKAQDVFSALMAANKEIGGVYGVNDSMALGAVDAAKAAGRLKEMVIFGNDGEKDALESIEKGELAGTQYTDVWQQGRLAAALGIGLATGGITAQNFSNQARILMPYIIATKDNVGTILPFQRW